MLGNRDVSFNGADDFDVEMWRDPARVRLGDKTVDVEVFWPGGKTTRLDGLNVGIYHRVTHPDAGETAP